MSKGTVNKVILIGRLGKDPDVRYMPSGEAIANISMATDSQWKDRNTGQMQEATEWHKVAFFGKTAEIVGQYIRKGSRIYVEGRIRTRKWQDQSGQDRYTTEIIGDQMQMLDSKASSGVGGNEYEPTVAPKPVAPPPRPAPRQPAAPPPSNYYDSPPTDFHEEEENNFNQSTAVFAPRKPAPSAPSSPPGADEELNDKIPF